MYSLVLLLLHMTFLDLFPKFVKKRNMVKINGHAIPPFKCKLFSKFSTKKL